MTQLPLDFSDYHAARAAGLDYLENVSIGQQFKFNDIIAYVYDQGIHAGFHLLRPDIIAEYERKSGVEMFWIHKGKCIFQKGGEIV